MQTVVVVIDGDEAHTHEGENLLDVFPHAQVVPAEAGQILDYDAVDLASLDLGHHLLKGRTVKIGTRVAVVHFHAALPQLRVARQIITDQILLARDAVAFLLVAVLMGQADISAGIPYLFLGLVHVLLS